MKKMPGLLVVLGSPNDDQGIICEMGQGRLTVAYQRFAALKPAGWKLLLTGGFGKHFNRTAAPHAHYAKQALLAQGLHESDFVEYALSKNTVDDALQARPIVVCYDCPNLLVVTSDFHIPRATYIFQSVFPDRTVTFAEAPYLGTIPSEERKRLIAHEQTELANLLERGESIVGGALSVHAWRTSRDSN